MSQEAPKIRQLSTFRVDELYCGIDVLKVQEVMRHQPMTKVPLAPAVLQGLINLRGQIVTAVDLRCRLGLTERKPGDLPYNVVVRTNDGVTSFLVDAIGDVVETSEAAFESAPDTLTGSARKLIVGVYKMDGRLLHVLDADKAAECELEPSAAGVKS
jgi:purine-binding chemotaxis protein CheW